MTLDEKVAQLTGILPFELLGPTGLDEQKFDAHLADGIGEIATDALLVDSRSPSTSVARSSISSGGTWSSRTRLGDSPRSSTTKASRGSLHRPAPTPDPPIAIADVSSDPH